MNDKTITIELSPSQRDLLLKYQHEFADTDLLRLFAVAVKKGKYYEIKLAESQLVDVCDQIAACANGEENEKRQSQLDDLGDYLEDYLPETDMDEDEETESTCSTNTGPVYLLKVVLEGDLKIWRTIAIRGGQTLDDLHNIIFDAFDRDDDHMYSFYLLDKPSKTRPRRIYEVSTEYTHPFNFEEGGFYNREIFNAAATTMDSLDLRPGQILYYLFDFGDEWWHVITVEKTDGIADTKEYPRIVDRKGESPEQYPEWEEEEDGL